MAAIVELAADGSNFRLSGWAATASSLAALITIPSLKTYLTTQVDTYLETGVMRTAGAVLSFICVVGATVRAYCLIPVAFTYVL